MAFLNLISRSKKQGMRALCSQPALKFSTTKMTSISSRPLSSPLFPAPQTPIFKPKTFPNFSSANETLFSAKPYVSVRYFSTLSSIEEDVKDGIQVAEQFDFSNLTVVEYESKIQNILNVFPLVENDLFMRRVMSKFIDNKCSTAEFYFFVKVFLGGSVPVYPLVSKENIWVVALKVGQKLYVFVEEASFSKSVVPVLGIKPDDISYLDEKFSPDDCLVYSHYNLEEAIGTLGSGYEGNEYKFMECLSLVYGVVIRGAVSPMMKTFVCETLISSYCGGGMPPTEISAAFRCWGKISKWYLNGCRGKCCIDGLDYDLDLVKMLVAVVTSKSGKEKDDKNQAPPKEVKENWSSKNMLANADRKRNKALLEEEKKKKNAEKWHQRSLDKAAKRVQKFLQVEGQKMQKFLLAAEQRKRRFLEEEEQKRRELMEKLEAVVCGVVEAGEDFSE